MSSIYRSEEGKSSILEDYEAYLANLGEGVEREYVETRFGQTHVLLTGPEDGKPLFILQGGNCVNPMTLSWFSSLFKDYRIIAPDTIGHPGYSEETRISARFDSLALWVSDLLDHYKIEKVRLSGLLLAVELFLDWLPIFQSVLHVPFWYHQQDWLWVRNLKQLRTLFFHL